MEHQSDNTTIFHRNGDRDKRREDLLPPEEARNWPRTRNSTITTIQTISMGRRGRHSARRDAGGRREPSEAAGEDDYSSGPDDGAGGLYLRQRARSRSRTRDKDLSLAQRLEHDRNCFRAPAAWLAVCHRMFEKFEQIAAGQLRYHRTSTSTRRKSFAFRESRSLCDCRRTSTRSRHFSITSATSSRQAFATSSGGSASEWKWDRFWSAEPSAENCAWTRRERNYSNAGPTNSPTWPMNCSHLASADAAAGCPARPGQAGRRLRPGHEPALDDGRTNSSRW